MGPYRFCFASPGSGHAPVKSVRLVIIDLPLDFELRTGFGLVTLIRKAHALSNHMSRTMQTIGICMALAIIIANTV
jgi:hypothetical protein